MNIVELNQNEILCVSGGGWTKWIVQTAFSAVGSVFCAGVAVGLPEVAMATITTPYIGSVLVGLDYGVKLFGAIALGPAYWPAIALFGFGMTVVAPVVGGIITGAARKAGIISSEEEN